MNQEIAILPCNGDCAAGLVTWLASQELVLQKKAVWCLAYCEPEGVSELIMDETCQFILVDGCERKCLFNDFLERGLVGKYQLALTDVGIEPTFMSDITREDIELAKNAIIAECKDVESSRPPLFSGCCCR